jgi:RNA polymerase sigma factor (sigma-70 family)
VSVTHDGDVRSDEDLLSVARVDPDAFEELYRRCVDKTVAFAVRRCGTPEQVHDLVAAAWLEVIEASPRFDSARGNAVPWILGVMSNLANDERRRQAREHDALRRLSGHRVLGENDVIRLEEAIDASRLKGPLLQELAAMPALERQAFELVVFGGVAQEQAARALGVAPTAFRMRLSRARRKLRAVVQDGEDLEVAAP